MNAALSDAVVAPDGRIVVCGYTRPVAREPNATHFNPARDSFLGRLNADGTPDTTFGADGTGFIVRNFQSGSPGGEFLNDEASSVALLPDGKIVVGTTGGVLVYTPDGTPYDPTGVATAPGARAITVPISGTSSGDLGWVADVAAAPGGAFYATGEGEAERQFVGRRTAEGTIDQPFGTTLPGPFVVGGGSVALGDGAAVATMMVTPDGGVILAGSRIYWPPVRRPPAGKPVVVKRVGGMGLWRLDASGAFDATFGNAWKPTLQAHVRPGPGPDRRRHDAGPATRRQGPRRRRRAPRGRAGDEQRGPDHGDGVNGRLGGPLQRRRDRGPDVRAQGLGVREGRADRHRDRHRGAAGRAGGGVGLERGDPTGCV